MADVFGSEFVSVLFTRFTSMRYTTVHSYGANVFVACDVHSLKRDVFMEAMQASTGAGGMMEWVTDV